ncbi:heavy metal-binding domain-containing protein [Mucilaginibacter sp.]|uniref:YbjQ family protein n=1 Tax=Mucilaginibacter sp. TaxID=1882438 RepID=UPI002600A2CC|nr:heavy metal-binding domain-containing protein [Mucilaginibacter sp.]
MSSPKQVLVVTTSDLGEIKIIKHLKPVSAHVVAGTNVFSDISALVTDFFGGRSGSYQRQLSSLYDEAIERIKISAFEIGANCVLGLKVDIDEISGKGMAMFMITCVGTAAIAEIISKPISNIDTNQKFENVSIEKINILRKKNKIVQEANEPNWQIDDESWDFLTDNQIEEVFPAIVNKYKSLVASYQVDSARSLYKRMVNYLSNFPENKKSDILYLAVFNEKDKKIAKDLSDIIKELQILDLKLIYNVLLNDDLENQKRAVQMLAYDKAFYDKEDITDLKNIRGVIIDKFKEIGVRSTKKQLLSSKEKDIWTCQCEQSNDYTVGDGNYCTKCGNNIYGFKTGELSPNTAIDVIDQKIELISHFVI